jgi:ComF family protein
MLKRLGTILIDVVYPPLCAGCDRRGTWLCDRCLATVPALPIPVCDRCGVPEALQHCQCAMLDLCLDQVRSALPYQGWVSAAVQGFKYRDETARATSLAAWLIPPLSAWGTVDALVPVPLHPRRRRKRGYNQAELLARELSRTTGVPLLAALVRTRHTPPQVGNDHDQRHENVSGAFALAPGHGLPGGNRYVLIDDVRTTGATLSACAAALMPAQPAWIGALTVAWTMPTSCQARWARLKEGDAIQTAI